ncbi:uncharacterized protein LOC132799665 [Ziziphus jujuba]|uniref:Uncharacterized protein LOC132799665 n=1 Tax=Ziziphus jujuba TaxID=326968 RepID=A0ABM3ZUG0_ZIZJJ|nr:uncharacterized protein LOC132799665 [Ziziphus jujuba]
MEWQVDGFRKVLDYCFLCSIPYIGYKFTWNNKRSGTANVQEYIDRCFANFEGQNLFPCGVVQHFPNSVSDHQALCLLLDGSAQLDLRPGNRFHFESVWLGELECANIVDEEWNFTPSGTVTMHDVIQKVNNCAKKLRRWNKYSFNYINQRLTCCYQTLSDLQYKSPTIDNMRELHQVEDEINCLLDKEESRWKQRSRDLFTTKGSHIESDLSFGVRGRVTDFMNAELCKPFIEDELRTGLFKMNPSKAPGHDGFPAMFYQHYWPSIGATITEACLQILNDGADMGNINHTLIALVPKVNDPSNVSDYRPISSCDVIYKMISKTLVNRLKAFLPKLISEEQSAFVPGRQITDTVLVAFEHMHFIGKKHLCQTGLMALKLDMSKAYDRVEWDFLRQQGFFEPTYGLRQGDPLSPYLFLFVFEGLSCLLRKYLGLPSFIGRRKVELFQSIKEQVWHKLEGWNGKLFSRGGKEIHLKAVIQSIPTYTMSCFKLPKKLIKDLTGLMTRFWWGSYAGKRGLPWKNWMQLTQPKSQGGLGFRSLDEFNRALLAKQCWRIVRNPSSLLARVVKAKYFPRCSFWEAGIGRQPSHSWRSLVWGRRILETGGIWRVGDGKSIRIYKDSWLPGVGPSRILSPRILPEDAIVACLLTDSGAWNLNLLQASFSTDEVEVIKNIPFDGADKADRFAWKFSRTGVYTVRTGYWEARKLGVGNRISGPSDSTVHIWWKGIWKLSIPNKVKCPEFQLEKFSWACWCLWNNRNDLVHGNCIKSDTQLLDSISRLHVEQNRVGIGMVVRNSSGELMGAMAKPFEASWSVMYSELIAIRVATDFCMKAGFVHGEIISDCRGQFVRSMWVYQKLVWMRTVFWLKDYTSY